MPLSAMEHRHLLAMSLDRMGTLQPQAIVSIPYNLHRLSDWSK